MICQNYIIIQTGVNDDWKQRHETIIFQGWALGQVIHYKWHRIELWCVGHPDTGAG